MRRGLAFTAVAVLTQSFLGACAAGTPAVKEPVFQRVEGALMVGITSADADPRLQAGAFAGFVERATGQKTVGVVLPTYDALADRLAKGDLDVAFVSPLAFVRASDQGQVQALVRTVRHGKDSYRAAIFMRDDRAVQGVEGLKAARALRAAWVDSSSATGHIFPKALLIQSGVDPAGLFVAQDFLGSHEAVCRAVLAGKSDVAATYLDDPAAPDSGVCHEFLGAEADRLRVVVTTGEIPNDVLAVRAALAEEVKGRLLVEATLLTGSEDGKKTLHDVFRAEGFTRIQGDDYEAVRKALSVFRP